MGDVVIVTGASRGIGKAITLRLFSEGYKVAAFGRDLAKLELLKAEIKDSEKFKIFSGDVTDSEFVTSSVKQIEEEWGKVDHLINNAGLAIFRKFVDSDLESFKAQMDVNMYGVYNFSKAVVDGMISRNSGSIITISSLAGKNGFNYGTMYSATKHAVMGFSRSLMLELREYNIRVGTVCPGSVDTDMITGTPIEPGDASKILSSEDVAEVVSAMLKLPPRALVSELEIRPTNPK